MYKEIEDNYLKRQNKSRMCAVIWTAFYAFLFPFLILAAMRSFLVFDGPISTAEGFLYIFSFFLIPLSLPLSIDLMWSSYICGEYNKIRTYRAIPLIPIIFVMILSYVIDFIHWLFI